ncbi:uncharacterized protein THITE_2115455 [Thermothielavioides terrestris NRRL 8126]|uniref:Uncharacterized protein n=2 Tax=Thermothielavioides terrestris TaxID=2587410 RepID=G2R4G0_THETT|nr:uncharacterized protein THITE_2115455 [Thermothielavioides terrestris NRRL 8126]AEO66904.1 hypothetical protein THITE_2115455 [Thermothielavioides terrestris NRRL 8126]
MSTPTSAELASATPSSPASMNPTPAGPEQAGETPTIKFTHVEDVFRVIDSISTDYLTITNVSSSDLDQLDHEREKQGRKFRVRRYHSDSGILIISIPSAVHEALHRELEVCFHRQLFRQGLDRSWRSMGSRRLHASGQPNRDGGEGDSAGGPSAARRGPGSWPTLVIEAGASETLPQLRADMRWWFSASAHEVKIVLLAKFDQQQQVIIIERWEEEQGGNALLEPVRRQEITIRRDGTARPASYQVTRGALVLSFQLLFLRTPDPQQGEGDFVIDVPDLQWYATQVWDSAP